MLPDTDMSELFACLFWPRDVKVLYSKQLINIVFPEKAVLCHCKISPTASESWES